MKNMPVVILAGGLGTRLREQTEFIPKPMVPIGGRPILWHIMKLYAHYGFKRFIICLGYKSDIIKEYFLYFQIKNSDFRINLKNSSVQFYDAVNEDWDITLADTGMNAMTGARIKKIEKYIDDESFLLTYGDGVADIDIRKLVEFHDSHGRLATVTGVRPPSRFGELITSGDQAIEFSEKPQVSNSVINGGFFVFHRKVFDYLSADDSCNLEQEPLERLSADAQLMVYKHKGFWHCMDTLRDMNLLNEYWGKKNAPWKIWKDE